MTAAFADPQTQIWIIAPTALVSQIKPLLQANNQLDRTQQIVRSPEALLSDFQYLITPPHPLPASIAIPTTLPSYPGSNADTNDIPSQLNIPPSLQHSLHFATCSSSPSCSALDTTRARPRHSTSETRNPLSRAVLAWLDALPPDVLAAFPPATRARVEGSSPAYSVYGSLLVLNAGLMGREPWVGLILGERREEGGGQRSGSYWSGRKGRGKEEDSRREDLWRRVCEGLRVSRVGINGAIPLHVEQTPNGTDGGGETGEAQGKDNVQRKPLAFKPLYGDFGQVESAGSEAFGRAYWVSVKQNGIEQVFAPLYTMFSRGNIKEKQRIAGWEDLKTRRQGGVSVVDLYAGIGYFAFSYARAGVDRVLCWELNEWSVEGFRRGAVRNGWSVRVVGQGKGLWMAEGKDVGLGDERFVMFNETNERALERLKEAGSRFPPVTHVNCGYLPSSEPVWEDAVQMLDPRCEGWVHAHENVAVGDIDRRTEELVILFTALANPKRWERNPARQA
ncbi:MAG: hypothetical protein MMC23_005298 [Stictis urceolatum]|nr:hypothetical protein [Stictis urceolata]